MYQKQSHCLPLHLLRRMAAISLFWCFLRKDLCTSMGYGGGGGLIVATSTCSTNTTNSSSPYLPQLLTSSTPSRRSIFWRFLQLHFQFLLQRDCSTRELPSALITLKTRTILKQWNNFFLIHLFIFNNRFYSSLRLTNHKKHVYIGRKATTRSILFTDERQYRTLQSYLIWIRMRRVLSKRTNFAQTQFSWPITLNE